MTLQALCWIFLGSALGGVTRFFMSGLVGRWVGETFPWGTMFVNVTGSFAIGVCAGLAQRGLLPDAPMVWQIGVTGFLGCYTTVSSFSLQTLSLIRDGEHIQAIGNVAVSLALCLGAAALGFAGTAGAA
jgi:CrcB protein